MLNDNPVLFKSKNPDYRFDSSGQLSVRKYSKIIEIIPLTNHTV
jgi:hypothetical protein